MPINLHDWLPILFCGLSVPISLFMWLGNTQLYKLWANEFEGGDWSANVVFI